MSRNRPTHPMLIALAAVAMLVSSAGAQTDPRARIFVERGCRECHAISALKMKASTDAGPDLTYAYGDVLRRYGLNLESFMANPTGVMRLMVASHLRLSMADRDSIVVLLRRLYEERRADAETGIPTLPAVLKAPSSPLQSRSTPNSVTSRCPPLQGEARCLAS